MATVDLDLLGHFGSHQQVSNQCFYGTYQHAEV